MKELSIEQKAQRYNEAIKRGLDYIKHTPATEMVTRQDIFEAIFPELKEVGGEKIRKALIRFHKSTIDIDGIKGDKIVSWLEKQGEYDRVVEKAKSEKQRVLLTETNGNANIDWDCRSLDDVKTLLKCGLEFIRTIEINKQILADNRFGGCSIRVPTRYDKGIKQGEQKSINNQFTPEQASVLDKHIDKFLEQNLAWSEEDECYINDLIKYFLQNERLKNTKEDIVNWLKSLRHQKQWKPSEEQLKQLGKYCPDNAALTALYNDLKQL